MVWISLHFHAQSDCLNNQFEYRGIKVNIQSDHYTQIHMNASFRGVVGLGDGAGSTSSAGASYNLDTVGQGPIALAVGAGEGGGCLDILTLVYPFSPLSPSLWETARYRLKYCLKGPLNPKQPTNQASFR